MPIVAEVRGLSEHAFTWDMHGKRVALEAGATTTVEVTGGEYASLHGRLREAAEQHGDESAYVRRVDDSPEPWVVKNEDGEVVSDTPEWAILPEGDLSDESEPEVEVTEVEPADPLEAECGFCGAEPGHSCVKTEGENAGEETQTHAARVQEAEVTA